MKSIAIASLIIISSLIGGSLPSLLLDKQASADSKNQVVISREFRLVDKKGNIRGAFAFAEDGSPILALLTKNGKSASYFTMTDEGPSFVMKDKDNTTRLHLDLNKKGMPSIQLHDEEHHPRAMLTLDNGNPQIALLAKDGNILVGLTVDKVGDPLIMLGDGTTKPKGTFSLINGRPQLVLANPDGQAAIMLKIEDENEPTIKMANEHGPPQLVLAVRRNNEPGMWLFDEDKKMRGGLYYSPDRGTRLTLSHSQRRPGVMLAASEKNGPQLVMKNKEGNYLTYMGIPPNSTPNMGFFENGQPIWSPMGSGSGGVPDMPDLDELMR